MNVLEYILLAEVTIVTGIVTGAAIVMISAIRKIQGTIGPIVGLINMFGARQND